MSEFEKLWNFRNLYKAHRTARLGKRKNREVIQFEMRLSENLTRISKELQSGKYKIHGYYSFMVHDPKERRIHALHYADRVVQHCLCDEILMPVMERRLVYDNAACRIGKGTDFARERLTGFMGRFYRNFGVNGWFLKCDVHKFFDSIDHEILKLKMRRLFTEPELLNLLDRIIDSYETTPGKGLPMGNQTSQWFALYYLDGIDRLFKERFGIKYYSRYMDDIVLIHHDKDYLKKCLFSATEMIRNELKLDFNDKTQICPIRNGVEYIGFHFYLTETGKVIRKVRRITKNRYKKCLRCMQKKYSEGILDFDEAKQKLSSYRAYLSKGHCFRLQKCNLSKFVLKRRAMP